MTNSEPEMELSSSSAQPHPFNGQIEELQRLVLSSGPEQGDFGSKCQEAASELDKIASKLRDPSKREPFAQTDLPLLLGTIVKWKATGSTAQEKLWRQAGRVAANLCAECDLAREHLSKHGYAPAVLNILERDLPHDVSVPLTASLLNLTNDKLAAATEPLNNHDSLTKLLKLTTGVPDAEWLWAIADNVVPQRPTFSLSAADFAPFVPTFTLDMDPDDFPTSLNIVTHSTAVLERFAASDKLVPTLLKDKSSVEPMLDFIEHADLPTQCDDREETDKTLGKAKAAAARTLVLLMSETEVPQWLWERVEAWFDQDAAKRPDLLSCALLAYGNRARSDATSIATLKSPSLLPRLVHLLNPSSPLIVQHALLGLLRNLSIPEANRRPLGEAGVIEGVVKLEPWTEQRDVVGAVQGAAIGVIKALVRDPTNAIRFSKTSGPSDLLALIDRTSDPAISLEATRVFVNAIRSLSSASPSKPSSASTSTSKAGAPSEPAHKPSVSSEDSADSSKTIMPSSPPKQAVSDLKPLADSKESKESGEAYVPEEKGGGEKQAEAGEKGEGKESKQSVEVREPANIKAEKEKEVGHLPAEGGPAQAESKEGEKEEPEKAEKSQALKTYTTPDALDAVAGLLAAPYPVLLNEGLVALSLASVSHRDAVEDALLRPSRVQTAPSKDVKSSDTSKTPGVSTGDPGPATKSGSSAGTAAREGVAQKQKGKEDEESGAKRVSLSETAQIRPVDKLAQILVPSPSSESALVGPEIKANAETLLKSVGGRVKEIVGGDEVKEAEIVAMDE